MRTNEHRPAILMFAKQPVPGQVKTRLTTSLSPIAAANVHAACCRAMWRRLTRAERSWTPILTYAPDDAGDAMASLLPGAGSGYALWPQGQGDLGDRLARGFQRAFSEGFGPVLAVGTDSPTVSAEALQRAIDSLGRADVCIGPTEDGGYYLLGMNRFTPALLADIAWSTEQVYPQTLARASAVNLAVEPLPMGYDVDTPADLSRLVDELRRSGDNSDHRKLLAEVTAVIDARVDECSGDNL